MTPKELDAVHGCEDSGAFPATWPPPRLAPVRESLVPREGNMATISETANDVSAARQPVVPDYETIKTRQQNTWASGEYSIIGTTLQIVGESLAEAVDVRAGTRVLD